VTGDDVVLALEDSPSLSGPRRHMHLGKIKTRLNCLYPLYFPDESLTQFHLRFHSYFWLALNDVLADDHPIIKGIDVSFNSLIAAVNPTPETPVSYSFEKALLNRERDILKNTPASEVVAHRLASLSGETPANAERIAKVVRRPVSMLFQEKR
jgi:hypothetical protein